MSAKRYLVSIASYRRPRDLARLLQSLEVSLADHLVDVVVVDNDPEMTARPALQSTSLVVEYVVETDPGIASARNAGLARFDSSYHAIVFVDDDEWVAVDWFDQLTAYLDRSGADVVSGPVITAVPDDAPAWVSRGGFYQRSVVASGTPLLSAATNNTVLLREAWVHGGEPLFDTAFSSTGGSDWDFFWGLRRHGARIRYCAGALVYEDIPPNRLSFGWICKRQMRSGIVNIRVRRKYGERVAKPLARAAARGAYNAMRLALAFVMGRGVQARFLSPVMHSYGMYAGYFGYRTHEYRRH